MFRMDKNNSAIINKISKNLCDSLEIIINKTPNIISNNISFKRVKYILEDLKNINGDLKKINNSTKEFP